MRVRDPADFKARRLAAGYSQAELARLIDCSGSFMSNVANAEMRIGEADAKLIAGLLNVRRVALLFEDAPDKSRSERLGLSINN